VGILTDTASHYLARTAHASASGEVLLTLLPQEKYLCLNILKSVSISPTT
jgi:hypothetical protein